MRNYRGKRCDNGEWATGYFWKDTNSYYIIIDFYITSDFNEDAIIEPLYVEVIPESVGQATGLADKTGKMIYEGDIIEYNTIYSYNIEEIEKCKAVVRFINGAFSPIFFVKRDLHDFDDKPQIVKEVEIIGNFADNPELLEG